MGYEITLIAGGTDYYKNSSSGLGKIQINLRTQSGTTYKGMLQYSQGFYGKIIVLGGLRTLSHELVHATRHGFSQRESFEIEAMQVANRIMAEAYGINAGQRKEYRVFNYYNLPKNADIRL